MCCLGKSSFDSKQASRDFPYRYYEPLQAVVAIRPSPHACATIKSLHYLGGWGANPQ